MDNVYIRSRFDGVRNRVAVSFLDENGEPLVGRTEQCHKAACDINNVIRTYDRTGLLNHVNAAKASYGDFTVVNEYQESLNLVMRAQDSFDALPSDVRKRFHNDPGEFLEFVTNPDNINEMVELGLAVKEYTPPIIPEPEPEPVPA